jgi:hypothetical protein
MNLLGFFFFFDMNLLGFWYASVATRDCLFIYIYFTICSTIFDLGKYILLICKIKNSLFYLGLSFKRKMNKIDYINSCLSHTSTCKS